VEQPGGGGRGSGTGARHATGGGGGYGPDWWAAPRPAGKHDMLMKAWPRRVQGRRSQPGI
jgi:hypothetical protein